MVKRAIIIGASSGIGQEVARLLVKDGWTVGVAARRIDRLTAFREELLGEQTGATVTVAPIDVTQDDAGERLQTLIREMGGMDLFFYAAGIGRQNRELTEDLELATMETNTKGFTRMIGVAFRYFAADTTISRATPLAQGGRWGHIAAITSIAGTKGLGPAPAYSATKAMQNVYLQALEQQANSRRLRIHFTDIRPGFVDTDLLSSNFHYPMLMQPEPVAKEIVDAINRKQHIRVIDWRFRLMTALWRRIPRCLWRHLKL